LDDVSVPTYVAVRDAFREALLDKYRNQQTETDRTPAPLPKTREKSTRERKKARR